MAVWAFTKIMVALPYPRRREDKLPPRLARITLHVSFRTMGKFKRALTALLRTVLTRSCYSLLTVGRTVDEAAILYSFLENACHSQLMAEAAAANGIPKKIISDEAAKYTADVAQNPVSSPDTNLDARITNFLYSAQHNLYTEFQPEFELIVEESNGRVLQ
jgi:hypothetical protein